MLSKLIVWELINKRDGEGEDLSIRLKNKSVRKLTKIAKGLQLAARVVRKVVRVRREVFNIFKDSN